MKFKIGDMVEVTENDGDNSVRKGSYGKVTVGNQYEDSTRVNYFKFADEDGKLKDGQPDNRWNNHYYTKNNRLKLKNINWRQRICQASN